MTGMLAVPDIDAGVARVRELGGAADEPVTSPSGPVRRLPRRSGSWRSAAPLRDWLARHVGVSERAVPRR